MVLQISYLSISITPPPFVLCLFSLPPSLTRQSFTPLFYQYITESVSISQIKRKRYFSRTSE